MPTNEYASLAGPTRPLGSPDIPQFFLPNERDLGTYAPRLYGAARIHFADRRRKFDEARRVAFVLSLESGNARTADWDASVQTAIMPEHLLKEAPIPAAYQPLPSGARELKTFARWAKNFDRWLARTQRLMLASKTEAAESVAIGPKRGGVSVELVGIAWELV